MKLFSLFAIFFFVSSVSSEVNQNFLLRDKLQHYLNESESYLLNQHVDRSNRNIIRLKFEKLSKQLMVIDEEQNNCDFCDLARSCGNRKCEPDKDENELNCYEDCAAGLIRNYNKQTICNETSKVYHPENEQEGLKIVREAIKNDTRVKVVGNLHSDSGIICTDGVTISTSKMKKIWGLEKINGVETVRVGPGLDIYEVTKWLHEHNRSLGLAVVSLKSVTIGGILGTAAHGSATKETSMLSDIIESFKIIKGDGNLAEYFRGKTKPHIWKALTMNLGLLGFITEVRIRVQENFNMAVKVSYGRDHKLIRGKGIFKEIKDCEWVQIHWFPATRRFVKSCGNKTDKKADEGAENIMVSDRSPEFIKQMIIDLLQTNFNRPWVLKIIERIRYLSYRFSPPFAKNGLLGKSKHARKLVGHSYQMLGSDYTSDKLKNLLTKDFELAFSEPYILDALKASKKYFRKHDVSIPFIGLFTRFSIIEDQSLLSMSSVGENFKKGDLVMFTEITHYKPAGLKEKEKKTYDKVYADWARLMITKYKARPHWAKNRNWSFKLMNKLGARAKEMQQFQRAIDELDPNGVFSNNFSEMIGFR